MSQAIEDTIMKSIMELFKGDAVKFFGINANVIASARNELTHIPMQRKTDDWLWETDSGSLLHFEFQSDYDKKDLSRFMVSDAILHFNTGKQVRTIIVYSAEIKGTITTLDAGAIQYSVETFYMSALDGDKTYADMKAKIESGMPLTKQDLMSIVFLPMMNNSVDKATRFEQAATLSKEVTNINEQTQVQGMIGLLAEKFISDPDALQKIKEMMSVGVIFQMMREDGIKEGIKEGSIEIAKKMLRKGLAIELISETTGLDEATILALQEEITAA